jgi:hypothetical protein
VLCLLLAARLVVSHSVISRGLMPNKSQIPV